MNGRLAGKVIVLTGATEGIGRAMSEAFVEEGARLVMVARRPEPGTALSAALGEGTAFVAGDVADPSTAARAVDLAVERFGTVDVLVNNAAIDLAGTPLMETSESQVRALFDINVMGTLWFMQACYPVMARAGGGSIINITSRLALIGYPGTVAYGASKGAVQTMTRGAAVEWAGDGVRVNAIAPGLTETAMVTEWINGQDDPVGFRDERQRSVPLGRFTMPDEVARAAVYFASDESASTTGASLSIDGGYTAA